MTFMRSQRRCARRSASARAARAALTATVEYVSARQVFGQPLSTFQNTKFELAAVAAEVEAAQALVDRALLALVAGELSGADAAIAKLFCTEMQARAVDRCLQLFGGSGFLEETPVARHFRDARVLRIGGGTDEIMRNIIAERVLGLPGDIRVDKDVPFNKIPTRGRG